MSTEAKEKEVTLESIKKGLLINRIIGLSCFAVLAAIFIVAILAYSKVNGVLLKTQPYLERIQTLDIDGIENSITQVNAFVEKTDFDHVSKVVESVPEDLFEQLYSLEADISKIATLVDLKDDLQLTMDNFNSMSKSLEDFQKKMEPILKFFSK
ncbi:MAG: hypothetical protein MJ123_07145 [Lachnospiraceae bacterium]|nr:hypothetical protein [Lachnospiraceae bacterium]